MKLILPLHIDLPRKTKKDKRIYLNLNTYRNLHYILNNQAKIVFKQQLLPQLCTSHKMDKITIEYILFPKTKRLCDTANICCIVDKFLCDALVDTGIIPEDNYHHVVGVGYVFGGVDKNNPRVEANIKEV